MGVRNAMAIDVARGPMREPNPDRHLIDCLVVAITIAPPMPEQAAGLVVSCLVCDVAPGKCEWVQRCLSAASPGRTAAAGGASPPTRLPGWLSWWRA